MMAAERTGTAAEGIANPLLQEGIALLFAAYREPDPALKPHLIRSAMRHLEFLEELRALTEYRPDPRDLTGGR